ncbi:hypothetical protein [Paragemmobacter straminiformis]|uniref:Uncharacterized protein n=1 Tax=Paragemmobacter straminiformis TaxID=2045119 RepID=A0A842IA58_9RHOB|nr:hypothetical protein [Gemmobacter straminiformis]MBC2836525.1 hypothetical protein [Gemmobacter straminiformis]
MPLTEAQHAWIETAQAKSAEFQAFGEKMSVRNKEMTEITAEIDRLTSELRDANAALKVTWDSDAGKGLFKGKKRSMDWMDGDSDSEVDTVHDLTGKYKVDEKAARRVLMLHEELVRLQTRMEEAEYEDPVTKKKAKVFSPKDIERELWSPLVMAEVLPSNAVADKYSQEAQVWTGACEIYGEILEKHTEEASEFEGAKRALRIGMDVVALVGSVGAESIKAANFDAVSMSAADKDLASAAKKVAPSERTPAQVSLLGKLDKLEVAERNMAALSVATTVVNGGLKVADKALDTPDAKLGWAIAESVYEALGEAASKSLGLAGKQVATSNKALSETQAFKTSIASATSLVSYGFKAGKVVFRVNEICTAKDESGRKKAALGLIQSVAGAIGDAFAAFDRQDGKNDKGEDVTGTNGAWSKIGAAVRTAVIGASNAGFIAEHIYKAQKSGGLKNPSALVGAIGLTVLAPIMAGVFDSLSDASRRDLKKDDKGKEEAYGKGAQRSFEESSDDKAGNRLTGETHSTFTDYVDQSMSSLMPDKDDESAGAIDKEKAKEQVEAALKSLPELATLGTALLSAIPSGATAEEAKQAIAERLSKLEQQEKEKEIGNFSKRLADDPQFKESFFADIKTQSDEEADRLDKLINDASPSPEELDNDEKAEKSVAALEKLTNEAEACNQKWQMVNTLTSGGASILVAALPVAGLVVAIQRLAMDTAILVRKSIQLNKWMDNMALTMGNHSVYGPAITSRLSSAKIQVSQQSLLVIYAALGVASEGAKLGDCTGAATGISIGVNMARALTEFGFKMHKEAEIEAGWQLYKEARANPGDRKRARKAMRWNSTLSKCVLAYGIVKDGDPIAKEVGRSCGLTPEILVDGKNVCTKVVKYFETVYSDDPQVKRRIPLKKDWHPGMANLSLDSWLRFKAAAIDRAIPSMSQESARTTDIDRFMAVLEPLIGRDADYSGVRDLKFPELNPDPAGADMRLDPKYREFLNRTKEAANGLIAALRAWKPVNGKPPSDSDQKWIAGSSHDGMIDVADSLLAQAQLLLGEVSFDIKQLEEREKQDKAREAAALEAGKQQLKAA